MVNFINKSKNTKIMKTFRTLLLLTFAIMIGEPTHADSFCFRKEKDAWRILIEVLDSHQVNTTGLNVATRLDQVLWDNNKWYEGDGITHDLAKAYRVRKPVDIEPDATLGEIIRAYMTTKYAKNRGEKYDYLIVCYSSSIYDHLSFMAQYPNSRHFKEIELKSACVMQNNSWQMCLDDNERYTVYQQYGVSYCPYDGFRSLSDQNNQYRKAVEDWYALMQKRNENPDLDCDIYASFISDHSDIFDGYNWAVYDSLDACRQRQAWLFACELHSIDGFHDFVLEYPESKCAEKAIRIIKDMAAWQLAVDANTHDSYSQYYTDFPEGDSIMVAANKLQQIEEEAWQKACRKNTIESYEHFVTQYPQGYYTESALKRQIDMEIQKFDNNKKGNIEKLELLGISSRLGYGLICFGNVGKSNSITVLMQGKTPVKVTMKPGQSQWVWVKNGEYQIYVTSSNGSEWNENGRGKVLVEDGIYFNAWYAWTSFFNHNDAINEVLYTDRKACDKIANEVTQRIKSEHEKLEKLTIYEQKKMLKHYFRQEEQNKEEYERICWDLENDANVGLLIRALFHSEPLWQYKPVMYQKYTSQ